MGGYHRLTLKDRYQISVLKGNGLSLRAIGLALNRSASSISRELKRNSIRDYVPERAEKLTLRRRVGVGPPTKITEQIKFQINSRLQLQWSPEQISADLALKAIGKISHETIYKYVYSDYRQNGELYLNLRRERKRRRSWQTTRNWTLANQKSRVHNPISARESIVDKRCRVGDYERDTVLGKNGRLLTIVDRTSRLTKIARLKRGTSGDAHHQTLWLLKNEVVHTITNDQGKEFGLHAITERELNAKVYFADPYCAWQRGTNENTNGLIRQYFPKGFDFATVNDEQIKKVEDLLNERPRKCLGFRTPKDVHKELSRVLR